jgi:2-oxoglutarate dehydrogenase E2 component (dihydrolipoamide succinyltransferase)
MSPDQVDGSGKRGQVLKGDVIEALEKGVTPQKAAAPASSARPSSGDDAAREERVKMTRLRQTIARRLKDAQDTAAMLTTFNEVDMSAVMDLRKRYKDLFEKKHGVKLGFMGFFTKAVTHALQEIPAVNAEIDGTDIVYKHFCHIGVAVGTDKGLVVPVVRDADQMSIAEIEKEIGRLGPAGARWAVVDVGHAGRHLHHLQWRRVWLADVHADSQCAAVGHSGHAQDPGTADGRER